MQAAAYKQSSYDDCGSSQQYRIYTIYPPNYRQHAVARQKAMKRRRRLLFRLMRDLMLAMLLLFPHLI